ncbi:hypothetical protein GCM10011352_39210 [Marinobacterium zhoushanense]|uniref:Uncharacterized protein n=1 Tax=Marinobacterium zhoushanense TaxID=1679163 RepID=A0ABQ1KUK8_9GAMM|nr:hypothetical protein GCM10011352_39210 [Marinobacterium zhoushanense]
MRGKLFTASQMLTQAQQMGHGQYARVPGHHRLVGVRFGYDQHPLRLAAGNRRRQHASKRPDIPGQRQLAQHLITFQPFRLELTRGLQDTERDRKIVTSALFRQIGRCQIDGDTMGKFQNGELA